MKVHKDLSESDKTHASEMIQAEDVYKWNLVATRLERDTNKQESMIAIGLVEQLKASVSGLQSLLNTIKKQTKDQKWALVVVAAEKEKLKAENRELIVVRATSIATKKMTMQDVQNLQTEEMM